jgi:predicted DCC family thiol-disulfide oxidoreductase YuxK
MRYSFKIAPPQQPLVVYDGDCGFCRARVDGWREAIGQQIQFVPFQELGGKLAPLGEAEFRRAVHYLNTNGNAYWGAEALFRAMADCSRKRWLLWLYTWFPPFAIAAEFVYRSIAANRAPIALVYRLWNGPDLKPSTYHISSALFLRLLGVIYLIAFVSLWTQIAGLIGDHGILPVANHLDFVNVASAKQSPPISPVWNMPTLAWLSPHDSFLNLLCAGGTVFSLLLAIGVLPIPALILNWLFYLSLVHAGQDFMSFQWDILLLETGFAAIFVAPFVWRSRLFKDRHPPRIAIWLLWWLLFRLMFESGAVKLSWSAGLLGPDGKPITNTWALLTALDFHYWTQPLPIWTSWYAAKLPEWFQKLSVIFVFLVELVLPWLIFGPRTLRYVALGGIALLMFLIAATGNYNFFNLSAFALAILLLDDRAWPQFLRRRISGTDWPVLASPTRWRSFVLFPFASVVILIGTREVVEAVAPQSEWFPDLESKLNIRQFCLVNGYGLFRRMTETRPEIIIEARNDAANWREVEFRWKPGDPSLRPRFNTPHQPRLDWQMWFEALDLEYAYNATGTIDPRDMSPWFQSFLLKLLAGEPKVIGLLPKNTFPDGPPKYIRISLDQYRFTDTAEGRATSNWWHRERKWTGPAWSLKD